MEPAPGYFKGIWVVLLKLSSAVSSAAGSPLAVLIGALVGASVLAFAAGVFGRGKARGRGKAAYAASGALGAAALLGAFRLGLVPVIVPGAAEAAVGVFAASLLAFTSAVMRPQKSHPFISVLIFESFAVATEIDARYGLPATRAPSLFADMAPK